MSDDAADAGRHRRERDDVLDLAFLYALDAVDSDERSDVESRIAGADAQTQVEFAVVVRDVHETMALSSSTVAVAPPAALRTRILGAIDEGTRSPVASLEDQRAKRRNRFRVAVAAAAAAIVVAVGGVVVSQQLGNDNGTASPTSQVLQASDVRTSTVDVTGGGTATVRWSRTQNAAVVTFEGLSSPDQGKVFEMWLIDDNPAPRPVGLVQPEAATSDVQHLVTGLDKAGTFAVSVEPSTGSSAPTTTPIAAVPLDA